jgi:hypothetical protein
VVRIVIISVLLLFLFKVTFDTLYSLGMVMGFYPPNSRNKLLLMGHAQLWALKYTVSLYAVIGAVYLINRK